MRTLVLLLSSGHTVRIALREGDLAQNGGPTFMQMDNFIDSLDAVLVSPLAERRQPGAVVMAYVRDDTVGLAPSDLDRISVMTPGGDRD
ncbi:MAG: hypothetical protein V4515_14570 [Chloroflexota bacterium]